MVVMNGVNEKATCTSYQVKGNSVIDLVWVDYRIIKKVMNGLVVWNKDTEILGDHRIVTMDFKWRESEGREEKSTSSVDEQQDLKTEKRPVSWKKRAKAEDWMVFRELLGRELKERKEEKEDGEKKEQEDIERRIRMVDNESATKHEKITLLGKTGENG
jgi:hypothetical protein